MPHRTLRRLVLLLGAAAAAAGCGAVRGFRAEAEAGLDLPEAEGLWIRPAASPRSAAALVEARRLAGLGRTADAVRALTTLLAEDPQCLDAHRALQDLLLHSPSDWWLRSRYERLVREAPE